MTSKEGNYKGFITIKGFSFPIFIKKNTFC